MLLLPGAARPACLNVYQRDHETVSRNSGQVPQCLPFSCPPRGHKPPRWPAIDQRDLVSRGTHHRGGPLSRSKQGSRLTPPRPLNGESAATGAGTERSPGRPDRDNGHRRPTRRQTSRNLKGRSSRRLWVGHPSAHNARLSTRCFCGPFVGTAPACPNCYCPLGTSGCTPRCTPNARLPPVPHTRTQ